MLARLTIAAVARVDSFPAVRDAAGLQAEQAELAVSGYRSENPARRAQVARITKSQAEIEKLCRDRVETVRTACLENPHLDPPTLRIMTRDPSPAMRKRVRAAMLQSPGHYADLLAENDAMWTSRAVSLSTPIAELKAWEASINPYTRW